ncbi:MAG: hypothetical protein LBD99_06715 [Candidatus Margulisbacteria bacterium]|jgi:hypothetical protein|nr:hypothetical protein [Candidatus Margulisiibacteriota bacterium]
MVIARNLEILALDMLNLTMLPVGTILMYDGDGWQDNKTLVGWYKCDGSNGTPDLTNRFLMGSPVRGQRGGANFMLNFPRHTHRFILENSLGDFTTSSFQTDYTYNGGGNSANVSVNVHGGRTDGGTASQAAYEGQKNCARNTLRLGHTHTMTGTPSLQSTGSPNGYDNRPRYYSVIYIKRIR